jgi:hypothetical protein
MSAAVLSYDILLEAVRARGRGDYERIDMGVVVRLLVAEIERLKGNAEVAQEIDAATRVATTRDLWLGR